MTSTSSRLLSRPLRRTATSSDRGTVAAGTARGVARGISARGAFVAGLIAIASAAAIGCGARGGAGAAGPGAAGAAAGASTAAPRERCYDEALRVRGAPLRRLLRARFDAAARAVTLDALEDGPNGAAEWITTIAVDGAGAGGAAHETGGEAPADGTATFTGAAWAWTAWTIELPRGDGFVERADYAATAQGLAITRDTARDGQRASTGHDAFAPLDCAAFATARAAIAAKLPPPAAP